MCHCCTLIPYEAGYLASKLQPRAQVRQLLRAPSPTAPPSMEALADYLKVFSEPNRLAVLEALRDGPLNVTAVVATTGLGQALVSKHLKLLTVAGVVLRRPEGTLVFYDVRDDRVFDLLDRADTLLMATRRQQIDALVAAL